MQPLAKPTSTRPVALYQKCLAVLARITVNGFVESRKQNKTPSNVSLNSFSLKTSASLFQAGGTILTEPYKLPGLIEGNA